MIDTAPVLIKEKRVHYQSLDILKGNKWFFPWEASCQSYRNLCHFSNKLLKHIK